MTSWIKGDLGVIVKVCGCVLPDPDMNRFIVVEEVQADDTICECVICKKEFNEKILLIFRKGEEMVGFPASFVRKINPHEPIQIDSISEFNREIDKLKEPA